MEHSVRIMPSCNQENMRKWIAALRSGDFPQATGSLHILDGGYCCLGVACEVAIANGIAVAKTTMIRDDETDNQFVLYDGSSLLLPESVQTWLGLENSNPIIDTNPGHTSMDNEPLDAIDANDQEYLDFGAIADKLESFYLGNEAA